VIVEMMKRTFFSTLLIPFLFVIISIVSSCNIPDLPSFRPKNKVHTISNEIRPDSFLVTGFYYVSDTNTGFKRRTANRGDTCCLNPIPFLTIEDFAQVHFKKDGADVWELDVDFYDDVKNILKEATRKALHKRLALVVDNSLISTGVVNGEIDGGMLAFSFTNSYNLVESVIENLHAEMNKKEEQ
jgi:hypothetical protein